MSELSMAVDDYIALRRALGHKMELAARLLAQFAAYCEQAEATRVTTEVAVAWATSPAGASAGWKAQRLGVVRGFAAWAQTQDDRTQVPPADILPGRSGRVVPYLYSDDDIAALMAAAADAAAAAATTHLPHPDRTVERDRHADRGSHPPRPRRRACRPWRRARGELQVRQVEGSPAASQQSSRRCAAMPSSATGCVRRRSCDRFFVSTTGHDAALLGRRNRPSRKLTRQAGLQPRSPRCRPRLH